MVSSRKSRNYKGKRPMFAFGQLVLPIAAILALGLLFTGIKLFFFAPPNTHTSEPVEYVPHPASQDHSVDITSKVTQNTTQAELKEKVPAKKTGGTSVLLAGPVDPATEAVTPVMKPSNEGKKTASTKKIAEKVIPSKESIEKQKTAEKKVLPKKEVKTNSMAPQTSTKQTPAKQTSAKQTPEKAETTVRSKPTVKSPTPTIVPSLKSGTLWGVQIGAFTKREGADILAEQAKKDGYSPIVSQYEVEGKQFFRVRVKSGTDRDVAATVAAELEKKGYPVALVPLN